MTLPPQPRTGTPPEQPDATAWRVSLAAAGASLLVLGVCGLAAWATGTLEYIQIDPALPPLHYNAAIVFVAWGVGYLALARGMYRAARAVAAVLGVSGLVLLAAHLPGVGLRLDTWAFVPPASCPPFPLGGVTRPMAVGVCLTAVALALAGRRGVTRGKTIGLCVIGLVLAVGGPGTLVFILSDVPSGAAGGVSVLGPVGAGIAGAALLVSPFRRGLPSFAPASALPAAVGVVGVVLTLVLWVWLNGEQGRRVHRQVQFEAAHVHRATEDRLTQQLNYFTQEAESWARAEPGKMRDDVGSYVGQHPGCVGVARVADDLTVSWVESRSLAAPPASLDGLGIAEAVAPAVRAARVVAVRPPRSCWNGTRVLVVFTPVRPGAAGRGGFLAAYRLQDTFDAVINRNVAAGYALTLSEGRETLFSRYAAGAEIDPRWRQTLPLVFQGFNWRMEVWPTREVLAREHLALPGLAVMVGLLGTALLALAVHLAQTARRRARDLECEIRERESTQTALRQSEQKYRTLIENLGQGIFLQDASHRFVAANPEFCRALGLTEAEIVGRLEVEVFDARRAVRHAEEARTVLAEGKSVESEEEILDGGRRVSTRRVLTPVRDATGRTVGVLGICWDVTEQRLLEARVNQASKMDAIGQLAGGIAHDFNNLLTAILGNLELILDAHPTGDPTQELAADAQNAASRAAALTKRLLGFARRHQLDWAPTDLNGIVEEVVALLRRTIDPLTRIETRLAPGLSSVQADAAQLNQVLMNLCLNARDAIGGTGLITVETECVTAADLPPGCGAVAREGGFVRLSVTDTGCGMTDEVRARIYEPFFTTKGPGKGTGLGLPMVFATVRQHKGWIDCRSEAGRGTRFDIYLPRAESVAAVVRRQDAAAPHRVGTETILVVDDEELIRRLAASALRNRGYRVLEAADGQQAIDLYSREGERIDLVVLDLTMPVVSGHETFRHLLRLNPRVRVMFASGYSAEQLSDVERKMMAGFVSKPYLPNDLVVAVERVLQSGGRGSESRTADGAAEVVLAAK